MKKYITLEFDVTNKTAREMREKYGTKSYSESPLVSSQYEEELLLPPEIDMCRTPDVNRFKIWGENAYEVKTEHTGWIINRKIYTKEELIEMGKILGENASDRYFLTSEGIPVAVEAGDESIDSYLDRTKRKLEELKQRLEEAKATEEPIVEEPKVVVIPQPTKRSYNLMNDHLFPGQTAKTRAAGTIKPKKIVLSPDLYIKVELKTNSANINKSTKYLKVRGENLTTNFNSDEIIACFFDESVIRTRFFKHELTPDYDGLPHPGKEIYQSGWIYNGDAYSLEIAYGMGLLAPSKVKEYMDSGATRIAITKCKFKYKLNPEDTTFDEYLEKCLIKEGSARKKD